MANPLKKLAGQTAIYGLTSIVGRLLNYLLVPLHTHHILGFSTGEYGVITEMYSYVAFLVIILAWGMETAYFRFSTKDGFNQKQVYSTIIITLFISTATFIASSFFFAQPIAEFLQYPDNSEFVTWFAIIVGLDALTSIPMARLRKEEKAFHFAFVNIANIVVNIGLNVFFLMYIVPNGKAGETNWLIDLCYSEDITVGYVFIANLIASGVKCLLLLPIILKINGSFKPGLLKTLFLYGSPLLIGNLAIIINEVLDKPMLKWVMLDELGTQAATENVGIYGACAKIAILMSMFVQAFRYAAEPFFFNKEKEENAKQIYANVMKYFVIICALIFLGVTLYIDIVKYFISSEDYWVGLQVVPILLLAYICYGVFYNLSVWYKLTGKTQWGMYIPLIGAGCTIVLNLWWIPIYGYMGSAWATLVAYSVMMLVSWFVGQRHYKIDYPIGRMFFYLLLAGAAGLILYGAPENREFSWMRIGLHTSVILVWLGIVFAIERPKKAVT